MTTLTNLNLVTANFSTHFSTWQGINPSVKFVSFTPNSPEASEWAHERVSYLFGGSGNTCEAAISGSVEPSTLALFKTEDRARLTRVLDELEANPENVVQKAEESLRLIAGFLEYLGKPPLRLYVTSSLYGESRAYHTKKMLRSGENMWPVALHCLLRRCPQEKYVRFWLSPQITPYIPYAAMLFIRPDFVQRCVAQHIEDERAFRIKPLSQDVGRFQKMIEDNRRHLNNPENTMPEYGLVHLWNEIQTQALARIYGVATVYVRDRFAWLDRREIKYVRPREVDYRVFAAHWKDNRAMRFRDAEGFHMGLNQPLWKVTDLALISTMQMFEKGTFRFLLIDHQTPTS